MGEGETALLPSPARHQTLSDPRRARRVHPATSRLLQAHTCRSSHEGRQCTHLHIRHQAQLDHCPRRRRHHRTRSLERREGRAQRAHRGEHDLADPRGARGRAAHARPRRRRLPHRARPRPRRRPASTSAGAGEDAARAGAHAARGAAAAGAPPAGRDHGRGRVGGRAPGAQGRGEGGAGAVRPPRWGLARVSLTGGAEGRVWIPRAHWYLHVFCLENAACRYRVRIRVWDNSVIGSLPGGSVDGRCVRSAVLWSLVNRRETSFIVLLSPRAFGVAQMRKHKRAYSRSVALILSLIPCDG